MKIPVTLTDDQRWTIVHIEESTWRVMRNNPIDIQELNNLKKYCQQFLEFPIIQALTGE